MKKLFLILSMGLLLFSCKEGEKKEIKAENPCCVCSGTGKESTSSGYHQCETCYGIGRLTDGRYSQVCK